MAERAGGSRRTLKSASQSFEEPLRRHGPARFMTAISLMSQPHEDISFDPDRLCAWNRRPSLMRCCVGAQPRFRHRFRPGFSVLKSLGKCKLVVYHLGTFHLSSIPTGQLKRRKDGNAARPVRWEPQ
jgi:hypothetical protein